MVTAYTATQGATQNSATQEESDTMSTHTETLSNGATITAELFEGAFITAHVTTAQGRKYSVHVEDCNPEAWEQALSDAEELAECTAPKLRAELFSAECVAVIIGALIQEINHTASTAQRYPHMLPYLTEETRRLTSALNSFSALI